MSAAVRSLPILLGPDLMALKTRYSEQALSLSLNSRYSAIWELMLRPMTVKSATSGAENELKTQGTLNE